MDPPSQMSQLLWEVTLAEILESSYIMLPFIFISFCFYYFWKRFFWGTIFTTFQRCRQLQGAGCQRLCWAKFVFLYIAAHGKLLGLYVRLGEWKRFRVLGEIKDAGGSGILEELCFLMYPCAWTVGAFMLFCTSTRITAIVVTSFLPGEEGWAQQAF